ncbi:hypothetical protein [Sporichthya sp.]|uniref:hypothetical protein n=1 Tax=Sporichthya sp. TaxID=65475 RepID=UPI0018545D0A|nr:hypothetical protein [Sporichthya sp.]MBA3742519.1 hypothetical protein [Sporichthya sp.]
MTIVTSKRPAALLAATALAITGCAAAGAARSDTAPSATSGTDAAVGTTVEWPVTRCGTYSGTGCAPTERRVDTVRPTFSNPTRITNPLFPIAGLDSVVLLGTVDGKPFRSETTLIPGEHSVTVDGVAIPVAVSQYTAYLDGRLDEVAIDRYAQADDGAVWYLGEDVYDYRKGTVTITEGSWLAGRDGPPAMIMPAVPSPGQVFRPENITGVVFEEVEVVDVGKTVAGPRGPLEGAVTMRELHLDGSYSDKVFAPGYGEFDTSSDGDTEALALAMPTDRIDELVPAALRLVSTSAWGILENVRLADWEAANPTLRRVEALWRGLAAKNYPPRVATTMTRALADLKGAVAGENTRAASQAAVDLAQSALDLELLYLGTAELDRFHLHAQQLRVHAAAKDTAGVCGEVAVLEWIRARLAGFVSEERLTALDVALRGLRGASDAGNVASAADQAARAAAELRG